MAAVFPSEADVRVGTQYGPTTGTEYTGTCAVPVAAEVLSGVAVDATTGTVALPSAADVLDSALVGDQTGGPFYGTYAGPSAADVLDSALVGDQSGGAVYGSCALPPASSVLDSSTVGDQSGGAIYGTYVEPDSASYWTGGTAYGAASAISGTFDPVANIGPDYILVAGGGTYVEAATGDVEDGTTFGPSYTYTGTFQYPGAGDVLDTVGYGDGGTEFTGTYATDYPLESDVRAGTPYDSAGAVLSGTCEVPAATEVLDGVPVDATLGTYVEPSPADVLDSAAYGPASSIGGTYLEAAPSDVQYNVPFGPSSTYTGTFQYPAIADVLDTVGYGDSGTEFTGTYVEASTGDVRSPVTFGPALAYTGTCAVPNPGTVADNEPVGDQAGGPAYGTYVEPDPASYWVGGTAYGPASATSGTFDPVTNIGPDYILVAGGGTYVEAAVGDVRSTTPFGPTSTLTGTCAVPGAADVLDAVPVDATSGTYVPLSTANVRDGVPFGVGSSETGTFQWPPIADVLDAVGYGDGGTEFTGTYATDYPLESDVRASTPYDTAGAVLTGTCEVPDPANVILDVPVDATVGTYTEVITSDVRSPVTFGPALAYTGTAATQPTGSIGYNSRIRG